MRLSLGRLKPDKFTGIVVYTVFEILKNTNRGCGIGFSFQHTLRLGSIDDFALSNIYPEFILSHRK